MSADEQIKQMNKPAIKRYFPDRQTAWLCLVLAALTLAVFGQTARFGFINFDDNVYVYQNPHVAGGLSWNNVAWVFTHADCDLYHPLTMLSLMADDQVHGLNPGGYHLTNVLLHTASVVLLFLVLRAVTGAPWRSAFVAAVFAVHPLRAESVAWVAERKDVLGAFFFILTIGGYVHYTRKPGLARHLMMAAAFVAALLSKPTTVTLPLVLLLLDYWPLQRTGLRTIAGLIVEKLPLLGLAGAGAVAAYLAEGESIAANAHASFFSRVCDAVVYYAVYLRQMFWPAGLAPFYPHPKDGYGPWLIVSLLVLASISGAVWFYRRQRPWLLTGWLWYVVMLAPMAGIVQVGGFSHADRNTYLPQIGICLALTWLVAECKLGHAALGTLMTATVAVLMVCAWKQTAYWTDSETLWTHTIACTTDNNAARLNLGGALLQDGKTDDAIAQFQQALQSQPDDLGACLDLGVAFMQNGRMDDAAATFQRALQIQPDSSLAHYGLGNAFLQMQRVGDAIAQFQSAVQLEPDNPQYQNILAWLLATAPQASLRNGRQAVQLAAAANASAGGRNLLFLHTLAAAQAETGQFSEAADIIKKAIAMAEATGQKERALQFDKELKRYETGLPLHD